MNDYIPEPGTFYLFLSKTALEPIWYNKDIEKLIAFVEHGFHSYAWEIEDAWGYVVKGAN